MNRLFPVTILFLDALLAAASADSQFVLTPAPVCPGTSITPWHVAVLTTILGALKPKHTDDGECAQEAIWQC